MLTICICSKDQAGLMGHGYEVLIWNGYDVPNKSISLQAYIDKNSYRLREKYLTFVSDLSILKINGKTLPDYFYIRNGVSYWWMNLIVEKSPFKSPYINECIKVIALEEILLDREVDKINLFLSNKKIAQSMRMMCNRLNIEFIWDPVQSKIKTAYFEKIYRSLPWCLQGIVSLRHIFKKLFFTKLIKPKWNQGKNSIFFMSYFMHLDGDKCERGEFSAAYWGNLPQYLNNMGWKTNWIHHFLYSKVAKNIQIGINLAQSFNQNRILNSSHAFLDCFISTGVIANAVLDWVHLNLLAWRVRKISGKFFPRDSSAWLWPLLKDDLYKSLVGQIALENCLWVALFDQALKSIPKQNIGFYLCENQAWEIAFINSWKKYSHGKLVGIQHSTTPFWHLYNFIGDIYPLSPCKYQRPFPSYWAVNGSMAKNIFVEFGYPRDMIIELEALRYQKIIENRLTNLRKNKAIDNNTVNILILGDIQLNHTVNLLRMIDGFINLLPGDYLFKFSFKSHPSQEINLSSFKCINPIKVNQSLESVLDKFDFAISANGTSAGLDAHIAGLPVAVALDEDGLNLNPLMDSDDVFFFSTDQELANIIINFLNPVKNKLKDDYCPYFYFSSDLSRWNSLISCEAESK